MSDYLTLAVVTATLHEIIQTAVHDAVPGVTVRVGPPRLVTPGEKEVSLYLYHLTPNATLRNADLPTRRYDGSLAHRPQAAVDLHYIISFSGEDHLATEVMLGKVIGVLHAMPVLTGEEIRRIIRADGSYPFLKNSDLSEQVDRIKLTPEYLSLEELTKLWSVFFQIAHRPSLQYIATPVLLDADLSPQPALPVMLAKTAVSPDAPPQISTITPATLTYAADSTLRIEGSNFLPISKAVIDGLELSTKLISPSALEVFALPATISAGTKKLQVRNGTAWSNAVQFALRPAIAFVRFANVPDPFGGTHPIATIQFDVSPNIGWNQQPTLWLNGVANTALRFSLQSILRRGLDPSLRTDLEAGKISAALRAAFEGLGITPLGDRVQLSEDKSRATWTLQDASAGIMYLVRGNAEGLSVYFGLAPASTTATVAMQVEVDEKAANLNPALYVKRGDYLVRLMVDVSAPSTASKLTTKGSKETFDGPLLHIPG